MAGPLSLGDRALLERLQTKEDDAFVGRHAEPADAQARERRRRFARRVVCRPMSDMRRMTASVRSSEAASGNWAKATRYCLSCVGTKPVGTLLKLQPVKRHQPAINHQRHDALAQNAADAGGIFVAGPGKNPVERAEEPAERFFHEPGEPILGRVVVLEQHGAQRRGKRQRIERRNHRRDRDGDGELLVELAGQAADERRRHEHRAQHQRRGDDRAGHFAHRALGGVHRRQAQRDVALDVFDHHDGVVHHDADGQHQAEQRQVVDGKSQRQHDRKRADEGNRHRHQRDDGGAPGLQENNDHDHDQQDRLDQRVHHRLDGVPHEDRRVIDHRIIHAVGKILLQFLHRLADVRRELEGVGAGRLEDRQGHGGLVVQQRTQRVTVRAQFDPGHVLEQRLLAVGAGLDDDLAEFLRRNQPAFGVDLQFEIHRLRHRLLADRAGGDLHVLFADGGDHVAGGQVARGDLVRVEPDAHGVIARAENLHVARAGNARQHILHLQRGIIAQINLVIAARRARTDARPWSGRAIAWSWSRPDWRTSSGSLGSACETRFCTCTWALSTSVPSLNVTVSVHHAVGRGLGKHVERIFHAVDGLLQRRGHGFGDGLGIGAGIVRAHHDGRRHHLRIFADGQRETARSTRPGKSPPTSTPGENGPADEKMREVHVICSPSGFTLAAIRRFRRSLRRGPRPSFLRRHRHAGPDALHSIDDDLFARHASRSGRCVCRPPPARVSPPDRQRCW